MNSQIHQYFVHGNPPGVVNSDIEEGTSEEDLLGFRKEAAMARSFKSNKGALIGKGTRKVSPNVANNRFARQALGSTSALKKS